MSRKFHVERCDARRTAEHLHNAGCEGLLASCSTRAESTESNELLMMLKLAVSDSGLSSPERASGTVARLRKRFESGDYGDDQDAWCDENLDRNEVIDATPEIPYFRPQTPPETPLDQVLDDDFEVAQSDAHFTGEHWNSSFPTQPHAPQRQSFFESIAHASAAILPTSSPHLSYHPQALTPPLNEDESSSSNTHVLPTTTPPLDETEIEDDEEVSYYTNESANSQEQDSRISMAQTPPFEDEILNTETPKSDTETPGDNVMEVSIKPDGAISRRPSITMPGVPRTPQCADNERVPKVRGRVQIEWAPWAKKSKLPVFLNRKEFWDSLSDLNEVSEPKKNAPTLLSSSANVDGENVDAYQKQNLLGLSMWCRGRLSSLISQAKTVSKEHKQNTALSVGHDNVAHANSDTDTDYFESQCSETEDGLSDNFTDADGVNDEKANSVVLLKEWNSEPRQESRNQSALLDANVHNNSREEKKTYQFCDTLDFTDLSGKKPFANVESIALLIAARHALQLKAIIVDVDEDRSKQAWDSLKSRLTCHDNSNTSVLLASHILSEVLDDELEAIWTRRTGAFGTQLPLIAAAAASSSNSSSIHSISDPLSLHLKLRISRYMNATGHCVIVQECSAVPAFVDRPARRSESVEGNLRSLLTGSSASSPRPVLRSRRRPLPELFNSASRMSFRTSSKAKAVDIQDIKEMQREAVLLESARLADDIFAKLCGELAQELQAQSKCTISKHEVVQNTSPESPSSRPGEGHSRSPPRRLKPIFEKRDNNISRFSQLRFMV